MVESDNAYGFEKSLKSYKIAKRFIQFKNHNTIWKKIMIINASLFSIKRVHEKDYEEAGEISGQTLIISVFYVCF